MGRFERDIMTFGRPMVEVTTFLRSLTKIKTQQKKYCITRVSSKMATSSKPNVYYSGCLTSSSGNKQKNKKHSL